MTISGSETTSDTQPQPRPRLNTGDDALVSIIMPVYGVEDYLDASVASALAQSHRRIEVILVDDGSKDSCPDMCDSWVTKDERVEVIHQENAGLSAARNTGMRHAHGEYLYFFDPDDIIEPNLVETCLNALGEYEADLVMFRFSTIDEHGKPLESDYKHNDFDEVQVLTPEEAIKMQVQSKIEGYFWAFLAPTSTYRDHEITFPEGRYVEDLARICSVIGESTRVVRIPRTLYHYRLRAGSVMGSFSASILTDWMQSAQDREEYIKRRYPELKSFVARQNLNFLANIDYETMRQSIVYGLNLDPASIQKYKDSITGFIDDLGNTTIGETTRKAVYRLKDVFSSTTDTTDSLRKSG